MPLSPYDQNPLRLLPFVRQTPVLLTIFTGIVIAVISFFIWRNWEHQKIFFQFQRNVDQHISAVNKQVAEIQVLLESVKSLYLSSDRVEQDEFSEFVKPLLARNKAVYSIEWVPRVTIARNQTGASGPSASEIKPSPSHDNSKAGDPDERFPVSFVEPLLANKHWLGQDLSEDELYLAAMESARDTDSMVASDGMRLDPEKIDPLTFRVFLPIYAKHTQVESIDGRRSHLAGYISGVFKISEILSHSWAALENDNLLFAICTNPPSNQKQCIYLYPPERSHVMNPAHSIQMIAERAAFSHSAAIIEAGKRWEILVMAQPQYISRHSSWTPIYAPLITLFATGLLAILVWSDMEKRSQLFKTNQKLIREMHERRIAEAERRRKEEALKESEARYTKLIETSPDGIFICTLEGEFLNANQAFLKMMEFGPSDLAGKTFFELLPDQTDPQWIALRNMITQRSELDPTEMAFVNKHGTLLPLSLKAWVVSDKDGYADKLGFIVRDISAQKQAAKESEDLKVKLQQAQKMESIGTLAGGIAHDFNNILGIIIGYSELANMTGMPEDHKTKKCIEEILAAAGRARELVYQILTFSRQTDQEKKPMQLSYIVKETAKFLRASIPSSIQIRTHIDNHGAIISANPTQMHQILMNLSTNAAHAMREHGGVLEIRLETVTVDATNSTSYPDNLKPGGYVRLTVKDTGHGIGPDHLSKIFDPYFTTKEKGEGTGLGLAVVHGIVNSHDGLIHVQSDLGKGTAFELFFPVIEQSAPMDVADQNGPTPRGTEKILIVDDEDQLVSIGKFTLEALGYQVDGQTDSLEALDLFKLQSTSFDLVITDMTMPHMNGFELAREVKRIRPEIPIILCTGFNKEATPPKLNRAGIHSVLEKPFLPQRLALLVRQTIDQAKRDGS